jgi:hypothetical protein
LAICARFKQEPYASNQLPPGKFVSEKKKIGMLSVPFENICSLASYLIEKRKSLREKWRIKEWKMETSQKRES